MKPTVAVEAKPWYRSRVVWANLIAALVAIAAELQNALPLPEQVSTYVVAAVAVANVILRFVSVQPVTVSAQPQVAEAPAPPRGVGR